MTERCAKCGANLAMVGRSHRCVPKMAGNTAPAVAVGGVSLHKDGKPLTAGDVPSGATVEFDRDTGEVTKIEPVRTDRVSGGREAKTAKADRKPKGSKVSKTHPVGRPKKGDEDKTFAATEPWKAEGISERTWYRRRAKARRTKKGRRR